MERNMSENVTDNIEADKYELYDRNIRLWGADNQVTLSNSHVLLINLNSVNTEIAKNLILSGINLYIYDKDKSGMNRKITNHDVNSNYFLNSSQIDQDRISVIQTHLQNMNQFTSVRELKSLHKIDDVNCVLVGFSSFKKLNYYEEFFSKRNIPFYCINTSGMYAFFYNNLSSISLNSPDSKNNSPNGKQINKKSISNFTKQIDCYFDSLKTCKNESKKKIIKNNLYNAICLIQIYHRRSVPNEELDFSKILIYVGTYLKQNDLEFISLNEDFNKILKRLVKNFNFEFNPVCSIIAGIVSQEVLKVLTKSVDFHKSLYTFDSEKESGDFLNLIS